MVNKNRLSGHLGTVGFTLIELLVVVLIIGILSAIALPQYKKAVERSKAAQAFVMLKSLQTAFKAYYLANGSYPLKFSDVAISLPSMTGHVAQYPNDVAVKDTMSDKDWSVQIITDPGRYYVISMSRISGPYKGAVIELTMLTLSRGNIYCVEHKVGVTFPFQKSKGAYCQKILKGTWDSEKSNSEKDFFSLPGFGF